MNERYSKFMDHVLESNNSTLKKENLILYFITITCNN